MSLYWSLFLAFIRVGLFGYGGGPAMIPLIEKEVVQHYGWLTAEEFIDSLAMANTLPGPIAPKMALSVGLHVGGPLGAATAVAAMLFPSFFLIVIFTMLYYRYRHLPTLQGVVRGVRPVVIALLLVTVANLAPRSVFTWHTFAIALATFMVVFYLKVHPIYTIAAAALIGYIFYR